MADKEVAESTTDESQEPEAVDETPEEAAATPPEEDLATLKKRLAGQTGAYNKLKAERDAIAAEREALAKFKAEQERLSMSELEKLQADNAAAIARAEAAEARAARADLARQFPLAAEFYGDDPLPSEERLAALEQRLAAPNETEDDDSDVNPNSPRRTPPARKPVEPSLEDLQAAIRKAPSTFTENWR
ncbi:MAG: hypothetical protein IT345_10665 [Trueperaceae bacterium]|nr:hypothetical protein [Trueperaceae bacterium]